MLKQWQTSVLNGVPFATEARFRCFDGKYRWFLNRADPLRDKTGKVVKWYGTNVDIEDLKRTESRLRRSEAYLTEAQRLSLTGSFGWIPSTGEIQWSDESFRIFQLDPSIKPTIELALQRVHPDDRALVNQAIDEASRAEADFDLIYRLLMPNGSVKYVHVRSRALRDADGNLEVVGAITDITAAKKAEEALRDNERRLLAAQAELSHINRVATLGELTASITHEVSQPLGAIAANAAAARRWFVRDLEEARSAIERIEHESFRAAAVITRMRELYKKADLKKTHLDINDVIPPKATAKADSRKRSCPLAIVRCSAPISSTSSMCCTFILPSVSRAGRYQVRQLIKDRGRNAKIIDWLDEITADCSKKMAHNMSDPCGARCPDLPRVL
jgi:hypothetical protein